MFVFLSGHSMQRQTCPDGTRLEQTLMQARLKSLWACWPKFCLWKWKVGSTDLIVAGLQQGVKGWRKLFNEKRSFMNITWIYWHCIICAIKMSEWKRLMKWKLVKKKWWYQLLSLTIVLSYLATSHEARYEVYNAPPDFPMQNGTECDYKVSSSPAWNILCSHNSTCCCKEMPSTTGWNHHIFTHTKLKSAKCFFFSASTHAFYTSVCCAKRTHL